ncbi:beta-glucosidase [Bacteroides reticulotermitis JCM 10512]|uniref:Beta-glucosidase n=1 Tax=Bacteroides reticulotermitis JCM 10512 TaxID=1445607 RepID=W4UT41_9BACE|nr:beta-glucosidase [Bacteroides reticulotermitis JCM 10512]
MNIKTISVGLCLFFGSMVGKAQVITPQAEQRAREIVSRMTLKEKIEYLSGYTSFSLRAIPRLSIPEIRLADGPQGIRNHAPNSTMYPSGILSASTWNRELVYRLGRGLGQDAGLGECLFY